MRAVVRGRSREHLSARHNAMLQTHAAPEGMTLGDRRARRHRATLRWAAAVCFCGALWYNIYLRLPAYPLLRALTRATRRHVLLSAIASASMYATC